MSSLNKVILIGRLGRDPEKRMMPSGDIVTNMSLATSDIWRDKSGQRQERTEWHHIVLFGKTADVANQYLKKGQQVYLEGRIQSRKYMGKDNIERMAYDIVCDKMVMLGSKAENSAHYNQMVISQEIPNQTQSSISIEEKEIDTAQLESDIPF